VPKPDPIISELKQLRLMLGRQTKETSKAAGLNPASVSYWEHGHRSPHLDKLRQYMDELGFDLAVVPKGGDHEARLSDLLGRLEEIRQIINRPGPQVEDEDES